VGQRARARLRRPLADGPFFQAAARVESKVTNRDLSTVPPYPGYESLRRGRFSQSASCYFLTLTTHGRRTGLNALIIASVIKREITALEQDGSWQLHAAVIMPDHLHLLVTLGRRLTLGQAMGRLKAKTASILAEACLRWQGNYFDHQLRPNDLIDDVMLYIFLNPYRAKLLPCSALYEWTWLGTREREWFTPTTGDNQPFPEWLQ
jgi:putative transposase